MKCFLKIMCIIGMVAVFLKLVQDAIDFLYENNGKKYITTEE